MPPQFNITLKGPCTDAGDVRRMTLRHVKNEHDKSELWSYHALAPKLKRDREAAEAAGFDLSCFLTNAKFQPRKRGTSGLTAL